MIIESLRLVNIKSFEDETLRFGRGITVIAGDNGAGKTTVVEAVGLALFGAWPQRFREGNAQTGFLRRGTDSGRIDVVVTAPRGRFTVVCTLTQPKKRGAKPVIKFDRTLLGPDGAEIAASPGRTEEFAEDMRALVLGDARIDDERLFRDIIGTEQGTFDAPFTQPEQERRRLFEKILGIEDFQHFEAQFGALVRRRGDEARLQENTAAQRADRPAMLEVERNELQRRDAALRHACAEKDRLADGLLAAEAALEVLRYARERATQAQNNLAVLRAQLDGLRAQQDRAQTELQTARGAVKEAAELQSAHDAWDAASRALMELTARRTERDRLQRAREKAASEHEKGMIRLGGQRDGFTAALERLEAEIAQRGATCEAETAALQAQQDALPAAQREAERARGGHGLNARIHRWLRDLAAAAAALTDAGRTRAQLEEELAAIVSASVEGGAPLPDPVRAIAREVLARFPVLVSDTREESALPLLIERAARAETDALAQLRTAEIQVTALEKDLQHRRRTCDLLAEEASRTSTEIGRMREELAISTVEMQEMDIARRAADVTFAEEIAAFALLDEEMRRTEDALASNREGRDRHLALRQAAEQLSVREEASTYAATRVEETIAAVEAQERASAALANAAPDEDVRRVREALELARAEHAAAAELRARCDTALIEQKRRVADIEGDVAAFERDCALATRLRREADFFGAVHQHVLRDLARRVGASIVTAVSDFADALYARIAPGQEARLVWDPQTYAVKIEHRGAELHGRELSGGQLMGVSLAVKLALIKWYAQCRIGFLDEPTTHLDAETRTRLADVIASLDSVAGGDDSWFDQLFVISHEESFSGAGRRIELMRVDGVSRVVADE
jgi:DNA repair protein SbcC/Rad50